MGGDITSGDDDGPRRRPRRSPLGDDSPLDRVELFGLDFVRADSIESVVKPIIRSATNSSDGDGHTSPVVVTPNVDHLVKRHRRFDAVAIALMERAEFVLPDGQPIVWVSRLLGRPLTARLPGSALVPVLWPRLVADRRRVLVVSSSPEMTAKIEAEGDTVHAIDAPVLDVHSRTEFSQFAQECVDTAMTEGAEFVFVTLGHPKQENIISAMIDTWPTGLRLPVFLAVGASFDMHYGLVRRAPHWMRRSGLEWAFRLCQEPRRLFRRYLIEDVAFAWIVAKEWRKLRSENRTRVEPAHEDFRGAAGVAEPPSTS